MVLQLAPFPYRLGLLFLFCDEGGLQLNQGLRKGPGDDFEGEASQSTLLLTVSDYYYMCVRLCGYFTRR